MERSVASLLSLYRRKIRSRSIHNSIAVYFDERLARLGSRTECLRAPGRWLAGWIRCARTGIFYQSPLGDERLW